MTLGQHVNHFYERKWHLKTVLLAIILLIIISGIYSCDKIKSYPETPKIEYESYRLIDTLDQLQNPVKMLFVRFSFVDGDGDLFNPYASPVDSAGNDTTTNSKLFFSFYQKIDGLFVKVPDSWYKEKPRYSFKWDDVMLRDGQNKTQKGSMEFSYQFYNPMPFDTINVRYYIEDLAYHKSNEDSVHGIIHLK
jgi:hypothetical protein